MLTFHDLYVSYSADVYRFAFWLTGDQNDAEDITSETFVRAWTRFGLIRTETVKGYLLTIARNIHLEQVRKRKYQAALDDIYPDPEPGPETVMEGQSELDAVRKSLLTLPEVDRAAFVMRVQHEMPYAEIARVLQISEVAVKVKIHRARKRMLEIRLNEAASR